MRALTAWLRATVRYNPTFPISALLLMGGIYRLLAPIAGSYEPASVAATAGVIAGYELVLVAIALLVLWPRRIAYETTSLLTIEGVLRFAPSFTILLLDVRQDLVAMLLLGLGAAGLLVLRSELTVRHVGLAVKPWERRHGVLIALLGTIGFPLLANELLTAGAATRPLATIGVAGVALVLAPAWVFLGRGPLACDRPLGSRLPLVVARALDGVSVCALLLTALWLNDVKLEPGMLAPLVLLVPLGIVMTASALTRDGSPGPVAWVCVLPGVVAGALVVLGRNVLAPSGSYGFLLPLGLGLSIALAVFFRVRFAVSHARLGERLALVAAAAAPLRVLGGREVLVYGALVLTLVGAAALVRKLERVFCLATVAGSVGALMALGRVTGVPSPLIVAPLAGALLVVAAALRFGVSGVAGRLGWKMIVGTSVAGVIFHLGADGGFNGGDLAAVPGVLALGFLALRGRLAVHLVALAAEILLLLSPLALELVGKVGDGIALVGLAFLVLPLGVVVALRREAWLARMGAT